jgi:hypothetical protein
VDERRHFDLMMKYASGHVHRGAELISPASLPYLSRYASPEFLSAPQSFEGGYYGLPWTHPAEEVAPTIAAIEEIRSKTPKTGQGEIGQSLYGSMSILLSKYKRTNAIPSNGRSSVWKSPGRNLARLNACDLVVVSA